MSGERPDPRRRPPDPAGTQPKVDLESLESRPREERLALAPGQASFLTAPTAAPPALIGATGPAPAPDLPAPPAPPAPPTPPGAIVRGARPAAVHPHIPRFHFLFGALGALGVCAVALFLVLLSAPKATPAKPWSAWRPADNGVDPAQQIADHVAPHYLLDSGKQIVKVTGGPPALKGQPMTLGVIRSGQAPARLEGNSVLYRMCGGGANCSIKEGKPSLQRGLLLSREALELALYTFRYVGGVSQVVVTIPPTPPTKAKQSAGKGTTAVANRALMFGTQDVAAELEHPLSLSLSPVTPRVSAMDRSSDAPLVQQITGTRFYEYVVDDVPQSGAVMLLEPPTGG